MPNTIPSCGNFLVTEPKDFFESIDTNHDGVIDLSELRHALQGIDIPVSQKLMNMIQNSCDKDHDGMIDEQEFINFCDHQDNTFRKIFDSIDRNKNGYIEVKDMIPMLRSLDYKLSEEEIEDLVKKLDIDNDNKVTYAEFIQFYHLIPINNIRNAFDVWITDKPDFDNISISPILPRHDKKANAATIMIAGGVAGAISRTLTAPLDRLKIILQASQTETHLVKSFVKIYREEGLWAYFKGNGTNVAKIIPETAMKFMLFDYIKKLTGTEGKKPTLGGQLISGALAGLASQTLIYPFEITKTRLALASKEVYRGINHCMATIIKHEGYKALYKGWTASAVGVAPYSAIDLTLFHFLKESYIQKVGTDPSSLVILSVGGISGIIAQTCTYPFALTRTRLQAQGMPGREKLYNGLWDCLVKTRKKEGFSGLFKGILPNMLKSVPAISSSYVIYEKTTKILNEY
jgi:solute carrier family 25 phosphate transporter 23/24/25/41